MQCACKNLVKHKNPHEVSYINNIAEKKFSCREPDGIINIFGVNSVGSKWFENMFFRQHVWCQNIMCLISLTVTW